MKHNLKFLLGFSALSILTSSLSFANSLEELTAISPALGNLWNNTAMIFGANADGLGVGTAFATEDLGNGEALFATNFHVVEPFCDVPLDLITDRVQPGDLKYECKSLFVLHDVAINTTTHQTTVDGSHPWKSSVTSLLFFDKKHDLAIFKVSIPADFVITANKTETDNAADFAAKKPVYNNFDVYMVYYSVTTGMIQKNWQHGTIDSVRYFETDQKLGLFVAIKHTIDTGAGSSGAPLATADGRIIGVNASIEVNQFYSKSWWFWKKLETHLSFYAIPALFLKGVSP